MDDIVIRGYKKRSDMTEEEFRIHKAKLLSVYNKKRYVKRKMKERDEEMQRKLEEEYDEELNIHKQSYLDLVKLINSLNDNGYKIKRELINELNVLENTLGLAPTFIISK
jgi:DNA polymerase III sliding clamp (beta) subunit (PCNA family)